MKQIARRYAKALFQLAQTAGEKEQYYKDLGQFKNWMIGSSNFSTLLNSFLIPRPVAHKAIAEICDKGKASETLTSFLLHVVNENRLQYLPLIIDAYTDLYYADNNIEQADVESAHTISPSLQENFKEILEKHFNTKLILSFKVNAALLGGFRVQVGSHRIDSSLITQLTNLSRTLKGAS